MQRLESRRHRAATGGQEGDTMEPFPHRRAGVAQNSTPRIVYWHRELPPIEAELMSEHTLESDSGRVPGTIAHRQEIWDQCYEHLMANTEDRLIQEVHRLGGRFAHVHDEAVEPRRDDATGEAWLHGRFSYMLYR
jgi:hypothetical protein